MPGEVESEEEGSYGYYLIPIIMLFFNNVLNHHHIMIYCKAPQHFNNKNNSIASKPTFTRKQWQAHKSIDNIFVSSCTIYNWY